MSEHLYFFDTYALFEFVNGNPSYKKYENTPAVTTVFNLAEFNYSLKKEKPKEIANALTEKYDAMMVPVTIEDIIMASDLKHKNKILSIPDVIGYAVAKRLQARFLTGDKEFKNMENVEFVQKQ